MADDAYCKFAQFVIFAVREGLRRSNYDGLSGVDSERVEILHVADRDAVVIAVADNFILHFLPSLEALLDKNLRGEGECFLCECIQFFLIVAES